MNLSAALFQRAENSNKPNQKASAAKRDQCMNPSLSTQSAFTTKLNVRKGPALLSPALLTTKRGSDSKSFQVALQSRPGDSVLVLEINEFPETPEVVLPAP